MVCKLFRKEFIGKEQEINQFRQRVKAIKEACIPFVVPYTDILENDNCFYLLRPYLPYTSLSDVISNGNFSDNTILSIWKLLVQCFVILHEKKITPNPIKPNNIFITPQNNIVVTDLYQPSINIAWAFGTPDPMQLAFLAPEYFNHSVIPGAHSDIWALGVLLAFMRMRCVPWPMNNVISMIRSITDNDYVISIPNDIHEDIRITIDSTVIQNHIKRPDIEYLGDTKILRQYLQKERRRSSPAKIFKPQARTIGSPKSVFLKYSMEQSTRRKLPRIRSRSQASFSICENSEDQNTINSSLSSSTSQTSSYMVRYRFYRPRSISNDCQSPPQVDNAEL
ncbi:CAMK family protein kinase [Histomonas meleagridis]|uniref:CAMK family protein kinase n=1 Tax=Histomonas meleagridis TaxID=135588 RepID=UPI00355A4A5E|nr:CAMK family protein kinase [Histomonas meleagridis]KAH0803917.1 CAMK family protein kinase [Histomonas meleagridis]